MRRHRALCMAKLVSLALGREIEIDQLDLVTVKALQYRAQVPIHGLGLRGLLNPISMLMKHPHRPISPFPAVSRSSHNRAEYTPSVTSLCAEALTYWMRGLRVAEWDTFPCAADMQSCSFGVHLNASVLRGLIPHLPWTNKITGTTDFIPGLLPSDPHFISKISRIFPSVRITHAQR